MLFKKLFKINLLLKTIICNYLIYIIFNFKCIPHNVGMFPETQRELDDFEEYSPQRGDVSNCVSNLEFVETYSPQRGDVSRTVSAPVSKIAYSPQRGDVSKSTC